MTVSYAVTATDLDVHFAITNIGDETLPASIGAHPAVNWPLLPDIATEACVLEFADEARARTPPERWFATTEARTDAHRWKIPQSF